MEALTLLITLWQALSVTKCKQPNDPLQVLGGSRNHACYPTEGPERDHAQAHAGGCRAQCAEAAHCMEALTLLVTLWQALSVTMRKHTLEAAARNVLKLRTAVDKCKQTNADRLTSEYNRLVSGLQARRRDACAAKSPGLPKF